PPSCRLASRENPRRLPPKIYVTSSFLQGPALGAYASLERSVMSKPRQTSQRTTTLCATVAILIVAMACAASAATASFIGPLNTVNTVASTIPGIGDVNPYGVALVPVSTGKLVQGHILISNFNNGANLQGTGRTIVDIAPDGAFQLFAQIDPN